MSAELDAAFVSRPTEISRPSIREVEKEVPQIGRLLWIVTSGDLQHAQSILDLSARYHESYLAWETLRKGERASSVVGHVINNGERLPFTGFEGYFAGLGLTQEEIVREIASIGLRMQKAAGAGNKWMVRRNLTGERVDSEVFLYLSSIFGAEIARLRVGDHYEKFRAETISGLRGVSDITYKVDFVPDSKNLKNAQFEQRYTVPQASARDETRVSLSAAELDGWMFASQVGRFGHPVIRGSLRELPPGRLFGL